MPTETLACPNCRAVLRRAPELARGAAVVCPRCRQTFPFPGPATRWTVADTPPFTGFTVYAETHAPPLPLLEFNEDEVGSGWAGPFVLEQPGGPLHLAAWFRSAADHWGRMVGPSLLARLISIVWFGGLAVIPCLGFLILAALAPPVLAGHTVVVQAQLTGKEWKFTQFFSGFRWSGATILLAFCWGLLSLLLVPLLIFLGLLVDRASGLPLSQEEFLIASGAALIGSVVFLYLYTRLFTFALPHLIHAPYCTAFEAMAENWQITRGRGWKLAGVHLLLWLINAGGLLCFGVGVLFTLPFTLLVRNAGYLLLAGRESIVPIRPHRAEQSR